MKAPFEIATPLDTYRLALALEEIKACSERDIACTCGSDHGYQRGVRAGLEMALRLLDLRIGVGS